jgi:hypothetical protein
MMKQTLYIFLLVFSTISCSSNKEVDYGTVYNSLRLGTWQVTSYDEAGNNQTSLLSNYDFTFKSDSSATAQDGSFITAGTWIVSNGNSNTQVNFYLGTDDPLGKINKDWHVEGVAGSNIDLEHSGDHLTLQRN